MFASFYAIVAATQSNFEYAAIAIFVAMLFDMLDGRVARMTGSSSSFGAEYDSVADMVSFGLAPAILIYLWCLTHLDKIGWLAAFVYLACTGLRLARFNANIGKISKSYFQGLPCPTAAAVLTSLVWLGEDFGFRQSPWTGWFALVLTIVLGMFMVSNFKYYSFKTLEFKKYLPFIIGFGNLVLLITVAINPPIVIFMISLVYALSGVVLSYGKIAKLHLLLLKRRNR